MCSNSTCIIQMWHRAGGQCTELLFQTWSNCSSNVVVVVEKDDKVIQWWPLCFCGCCCTSWLPPPPLCASSITASSWLPHTAVQSIDLNVATRMEPSTCSMPLQQLLLLLLKLLLVLVFDAVQQQHVDVDVVVDDSWTISDQAWCSFFWNVAKGNSGKAARTLWRESMASAAAVVLISSMTFLLLLMLLWCGWWWWLTFAWNNDYLHHSSVWRVMTLTYTGTTYYWKTAQNCWNPAGALFQSRSAISVGTRENLVESWTRFVES